MTDNRKRLIAQSVIEQNDLIARLTEELLECVIHELKQSLSASSAHLIGLAVEPDEGTATAVGQDEQ